MMEADGTVSMAVAECGDIEYDYLLRDDTYEKYWTFDVRINAVIEDGSTFIEPDTLKKLIQLFGLTNLNLGALDAYFK